MNNTLQQLLEQKQILKRCIEINELSNDCYYLSSLYKQHQQKLIELECQIKNLQKAQNS